MSKTYPPDNTYKPIDSGGGYYCPNCGAYINSYTAHICPNNQYFDTSGTPIGQSPLNYRLDQIIELLQQILRKLEERHG